jgi:hypothetical protein
VVALRHLAPRILRRDTSFILFYPRNPWFLEKV